MKKQNKFVLTAEEKKIEKDRNEGKYIPVEDFNEEQEKLIEAARMGLKKTETITIRLSKYTLQEIKLRAVREGIPYQTLIGSILHKYTQE